MADNENKEYSAQEVMSLLQEISSAISSGDYQNLKFGTPADSSTYDALAANSHAMIQNFTQRYAGEMIRAQQLKRRNAVSAAVGGGAQGAELLDTLSQFAPGLSNALLGHHGADEAMNSMLLNANGIASAVGGTIGGILDPRQMHQNIRRAATQGALAINNAFNSDGTINAKFSSGLSLPQQAVVANSILANKDQYSSWSEKELAKTREWQRNNPEGTTEERMAAGVLSETEISKFKNGTGFTAEAVRSFNDHIKDFQQEMNGFVASVSKITGSFDTAIDFIQDMTNGKAFSAGAQAKSLRDRAMQVASNLRTMAADAGVDSVTMSHMHEGFGGLFERAQGKSAADSLMGDRAVSSNMASLATSMFLNWRKANPNATETEAQVAKASIDSRVAGFAQGDAVKDNVLLADLVRQGRISKEEAQDLAANGDQELVRKRLEKEYGASTFQMLRNNEAYMTRTSKKNSEFINTLNEASITSGFGNESILYNQREALKLGKDIVGGAVSSALGRNVDSEIDTMHKEELLNTQTLKQLGLSENQIEEIQEKAEKEGWNASAASKYLRENTDVDEMELNAVVSRKLGNRLAQAYGDTEAGAGAVKTFTELTEDVNPAITDEDIERKLAEQSLEPQRKKLKDTTQRYYAAIRKGDQATVDSILEEMHSTAIAAVGGEGDYSYANKGFDDYMLESLAAKDSSFGTEEGRARYRDLLSEGRDRGLSGTGLMAFVSDSMAVDEQGVAHGEAANLKNADWRKKRFEEFRQREAAASLFGHLTSKTDLSEDQKKELNEKFVQDFAETIKSDPKLLASLDKQYAAYSGSEKEALIARELVQKVGQRTIGTSGDTGKIFTESIDLEGIRDFLTSDEAQKVINGSALSDFVHGVDIDIGKAARNVNLLGTPPEERRKAVRDIRRERADTDVSLLRSEARLGDLSQVSAEQGARDLHANTLEQTMSMDIQQAEAANRAFGQLSPLDENVLKRRLGLKGKMHSLEGMMSGKNSFESQAQSRKKGFTAGQIANVFENFLEKNGSLSEEEFRDAIKNDGGIKGLGLVNSLLDRRDDNGQQISAKYAMGAYISAARNPEDVKGALEKGYISEAIKRGDTNVSTDVVDVLRGIKDTLDRIAPDVGSK